MKLSNCAILQNGSILVLVTIPGSPHSGIVVRRTKTQLLERT
jgi:hypothetical protein